MQALPICECRPSKSDFVALSEFTFIKFCAELDDKTAKKKIQIFKNFVKLGQTYEKVSVFKVLHLKVKFFPAYSESFEKSNRKKWSQL